MVVIGVVLFISICLVADWLLRRSVKPKAEPVGARPVRPDGLVLAPPLYVGGFAVQEEMAFHPGHAWAYVEGPDLVRVGMDDFARKLIGRVEGVELPRVGDKVVQGEPAWALKRGDRKASMLSPFSGEVVEVNPRVAENPSMVQASPYGEGWLFRVRPSNLRANLNNLLAGSVIRRWMEEVSMNLRVRLNHGLALSFPDGGTAVEDLSAAVSEEQWQELVREFLLTDL